MLGLDVSNNNGPVDWEAVARDPRRPRFAYLKTSDGLSFVDPLYSRNRRAASRAGLVVGAYHYGRPAGDPVEQARHFLAVASPKPDELIPCLDIEETDGRSPSQVRAWLVVFLAACERALGRAPVVYCSPGFARAQGFERVPRLRSSPLWLAHWTSRQRISVPAPWPRATFWQFTARARLPGIAGPVDLNRLLHPCDPLHCLRLGR